MYKPSDKIETKLEYILKHSSPTNLIDNLKLVVEIESIESNVLQNILKIAYDIEFDSDSGDDFYHINYLAKKLINFCENFNTNPLSLQLENNLTK